MRLRRARAGRAEPDNARYLVDLAELLNEQGLYFDARDCAKRALEQPEPPPAAWRELGRALGELDDPVKLHLYTGRALQLEGACDEALRAYAGALELAPQTIDALRWRAEMLRDAGRHEAAVSAFRAALEHFPGTVDLWDGLAWLLWERSEPGGREEAIECFRRAVLLETRRWFDLPPEVRRALNAERPSDSFNGQPSPADSG